VSLKLTFRRSMRMKRSAPRCQARLDPQGPPVIRQMTGSVLRATWRDQTIHTGPRRRSPGIDPIARFERCSTVTAQRRASPTATFLRPTGAQDDAVV
jgi:hypothetical protein